MLIMKKLMTIVISTMLCVALFAGCGQAEEKELTGTIDEIKDFMFVITDDEMIRHIALPLRRSRKVWRMSAKGIL